MSEASREYLELQKGLVRIRWMHQGTESPEEDALLDEMDAVWWQLTDEERHTVNSSEPKSLIRWEARGSGHRELTDLDVWSSAERGFYAIAEVA